MAECVGEARRTPAASAARFEETAQNARVDLRCIAESDDDTLRFRRNGPLEQGPA